MKSPDVYSENEMKAEQILHDKNQEIIASEYNDIAKEANEISTLVHKQTNLALIVSVFSVITAIVTALVTYFK